MERKLTAILCADVQGYSRLMGEDEVGTLHTLTAYREVTDSLIQQHRGRIVGTAGDGLLAEFASAVDAVQCAVKIQQILQAKNTELPPDRRMEFRIGINVGDVIVEGPQIYGDGVNIAARMEALADGGGICISGTVYDQVENKLTLGYESLGEQSVKNIAKPVRVWRVLEPEAMATAQVQSNETALLLPLPDKPSIIILPFLNLSNDPEQEYFSDGITEDLTTDLSKISSLFVISRNSAFTYKGKAAKSKDISREMGVRYVLEGSVRKAGERVRVTAQLIDAPSDYHLWAARYDRPLTDIFAVQDEIVQRIVTTLKLQLTLSEHGVLVRKTTDNLEAYDWYLRGMESVCRFTKEANGQARQLYDKALELDPQYAAAYASLSMSYMLDWIFQWSSDSQILVRAAETAQKALALDDALPQAHATLGYVYLWQKQHDQAIAETQRAIALDPNFAQAYANLGHFLVYAGRPEETVELVQKAMRLNPRYPATYLLPLGNAYFFTGRYEEALAVYKTLVTRNPNFPVAHAGLAMTYSMLNRDGEAQAEATEVMRINPQLSLEVVKFIFPFKDPAMLEFMLTALRKAGLK
ncbi:MAG: adenylate/guanylate cyclase domain-containing protein [Deltaproteobacteria bacterium]|nr:adenylate/guanylate cyclase domain-containing protein [Deltaproteobacteria bacterium]